MTQSQKHLGRFLQKHPEKWHTYASDKATTESVCAFVNLGILTINDYTQMRVKSQAKLQQFMQSA